MSKSLWEKVIPVLSLICGAVVASVVAQLIAARGPEVKAEARFAELDPQLQERILAAAEGFVERPSGEQQRLKEIYAMVAEDLSQEAKLKRLADWFQGLDVASRDALRPNGEFPEDWAKEVAQKYFDQMNDQPEILIRLAMPDDLKNESPKPFTLSFTEGQFFDFVDTLLPVNLPSELQWKLHGLTKPHEVALVKSLWFSHDLLGGTGSRVDWWAMLESTKFTKGQIETNLLSSADLEVIDQWKTAIFERWGKGVQDNTRCDVILTSEIVRQGIAYMEKKIQKPDESQRLAAIGALTREEQLDLFGKDPANAMKRLNEIALEQSGNVEAADLLIEYRRVSSEFDQRLSYLYSRVGGGGNPRGGPGRRPEDFQGRNPEMGPRPGGPGGPRDPDGPRGPNGGRPSRPDEFPESGRERRS